MKVLGINGSPRKQWNTATLVGKALEGAASAGAEVEMINLYSSTFKGCVSCFACKRKGSKTNGLCAVRDELTPILQKALEADAVVIGTPIYYSYPSAYTRAFLERFLFPLDSYMFENGIRKRILDKVIPSAIIFTMNCPEAWLEKYHYPTILDSNRIEMARVLGYAEKYFSCDTYQFADYSKIEMSLFDEAEKRRHRDIQFPVDQKNCFDLGVRLAEKAREFAKKES